MGSGCRFLETKSWPFEFALCSCELKQTRDLIFPIKSEMGEIWSQRGWIDLTSESFDDLPQANTLCEDKWTGAQGG